MDQYWAGIINSSNLADKLYYYKPYQFDKNTFIENFSNFESAAYNSPMELFEMGFPFQKINLVGKVDEFYKSDVFPRAERTVGKFLSHNMRDQLYDNIFSGYLPKNWSGGYYPRKNRIVINKNNDDYTTTLAHELNHKFRHNLRPEIITETYTPNELQALKKVATPTYLAKIKKPWLELNATLTELRYTYWNELKTLLQRTPTTKELDTYIDNIPDKKIFSDVYSRNSYGHTLVQDYSNLNLKSNNVANNIKDAMKYVPGVVAPIIFTNSNNSKENHSEN